MMRKRYISLLAIALGAFLATSCVMYHPMNVDIPLLEEQGDLRIDASASMSLPLLSQPALNATVSYAPLPFVAVQAAGNITDGGNYSYRGAIGFYTPFRHSVLEAYFGYGHGHGDYTSSENLPHHTAEGPYNLLFNQLNYGWNNIGSSSVDCGLGVRTGIMRPDLSYTRWDSEGTVTDQDAFDSPCFLLEPQLMVRFGGEHIKISLNLAYSLLSGWPTENSHFNYERFSLGAGVNYRF